MSSFHSVLQEENYKKHEYLQYLWENSTKDYPEFTKRDMEEVYNFHFMYVFMLKWKPVYLSYIFILFIITLKLYLMKNKY